ncbi:MAG: PEP-CTERM sorting domain-containing protein [Verrucomicrobiales bacterium]|jgi:hypothetical protein|nr:PEP-CTERM sorting domain-containing protein [Verrucomicrobiales bacterium]
MDGTLVAAWNITQTDIGDRTVNGVTFTSVPYNNPPAGLFIACNNFAATNLYFNSSSVLSGPYRDIVGSGVYAPDAATPLYLQLNGLTVGVTYQVKFWVHDQRVASNGRYLVLTTDGSVSGNIPVNQNNASEYNNPGNLVVCNFTATTDTQLFTITAGGAAAANAFLNALTVSVIPEPQTWALILGGGGVLLACRRRFRAVRSLSAVNGADAAADTRAESARTGA